MERPATTPSSELKVTYGRKDGQQVTIPCTTIFHTDSAGKIDD